MTEHRRAARAYIAGCPVRRHAAAPQNTCGYAIMSCSRSTWLSISVNVSRSSPAKSAAADVDRAALTLGCAWAFDWLSLSRVFPSQAVPIPVLLR
eukprot:CAMPEP_0181385196 /NCGR_PEP_ID=MMETSP1106-20121128/22413_1 /TAXON_ID=81844 /ORGANISM="Mantoniella antarctica, Strain SL-175" /LENGTH=94 /DNA_ID=CAMNT_0023505205 /DNA_START=11 /DNA_END=292 /DNA_ORIENTATION=-